MASPIDLVDPSLDRAGDCTPGRETPGRRVTHILSTTDTGFYRANEEKISQFLGSVEIHMINLFGGGHAAPRSRARASERWWTVNFSSDSAIMPSRPHLHPGGPGAAPPAEEVGRRATHHPPTQETRVSTEPIPERCKNSRGPRRIPHGGYLSGGLGRPPKPPASRLDGEAQPPHHGH
ncbi:hypothetical protein J2129_000938 [Methanofollis sp. W23]|nr:hypothetical protein [Methanofollis sp. W23]